MIIYDVYLYAKRDIQNLEGMHEWYWIENITLHPVPPEQMTYC